MDKASPNRPPVARRQPHVSQHHGFTLSDDYAWLRAPNWQEVMRDPARLDPTIWAYLEAENAYTEAAMATTGALQEKLFAEMKGRIKQDDFERPLPRWPFRLRDALCGRRPATPHYPHPPRRRR